MNFEKLVASSIERIKIHQPADGYYLAFSGGKDSCVIKALADMAGAKYDAHYSVTTIDPPELVYFIRRHHADVIWDRPKIPLLKKLETKGFPMKQKRWCCAIYKETGGSGRRTMTGLRWDESPQGQRGKRRMTETCYKDPAGKTYLHPIIDWREKDVWQFIGKYNIPYCSIYDDGVKRAGCLFCPMAGKRRLWDLERYPQYVNTFIKSFEALHANRKARGLKSVDRWKDGREMFYWWVNGKR